MWRVRIAIRRLVQWWRGPLTVIEHKRQAWR
jgi:hypothetical protein